MSCEEIIYKSHVQEKTQDQSCAYFKFNEKICYQNSSGGISESQYGVHRNVKMLAVQFLSSSNPQIFDLTENFVYDRKVQLSLHKRYLSIISPKKHEKKLLQQREYDQIRDQTPKRKQMHEDIDKIRDETEERQEMHSKIDKKRDQTEGRKEMHSKINKIRDETEERQEMHADIEKTPKRKARDQTEKRKKMHSKIDKKRDQTEERQEMHSKVDKKRDKIRNKTEKRKLMRST